MNTLFKPYEEHTFPDWTIEEFDAIECHHHFSGRYQKAKENALKKYRRKTSRPFIYIKPQRRLQPASLCRFVYTLPLHILISSGMCSAIQAGKVRRHMRR